MPYVLKQLKNNRLKIIKDTPKNNDVSHETDHFSELHTILIPYKKNTIVLNEHTYK